jgi:hypothetical protein
MAETSKLWREWQERDARRRAALLVQDAVICWRHNRQPFYTLQTLTGMGGGVGLEQKALHDEFMKVCNGTD